MLSRRVSPALCRIKHFHTGTEHRAASLMFSKDIQMLSWQWTVTGAQVSRLILFLLKSVELLLGGLAWTRMCWIITLRLHQSLLHSQNLLIITTQRTGHQMKTTSTSLFSCPASSMASSRPSVCPVGRGPCKAARTTQRTPAAATMKGSSSSSFSWTNAHCHLEFYLLHI